MYVLDNSVVSALHQADALLRVLELWAGQWLIPLEVKQEASQWTAEAKRILAIMDNLCARGVAAYVVIEPSREGTLFASLSRALGQGESATIAIAYHRGLGAALDDHAARRACQRLVPPVPWIATEEILRWAIVEGRLTVEQARDIWTATDLRDPRRQVL